MHALHFPTTFQTQMDVPCSRLYSLLPPLPFLPLLCATPLYLWLTQFPGLIHPAVLRQTVERQPWLTDWQTDTKAHQQAGTDASAVPITVPTHPFARMNPSLSASWCQIQIRFFVFPAPDTHATPPAPSQHHLLFGLKREKLEAHPSFHCSAITGWAAKHPLRYNFTSSALSNLWPGADRRNSSCQKSGGNSQEGDGGGRYWRSGLADYPFVWVHHDSMTWSTSRKCILEIRNDCSISWDWIL